MSSPGPAFVSGSARFPARCHALALACLLVFAAPAFSHTAARANAGREPEPRLVLPGSRVVRPGQWIDLRWSAAGEIEEMEILLSVDGGRHYSECISPQLDPEARHFLWRVPENPGGDLRLRIRFNRAGREIEGAPTAALVVGSGDRSRPEPLALPPFAGDDGEREPRSPGGRGGAPASESAAESPESADDPATTPGADSWVEPLGASIPDTPRPAESAIHARFTPPRSVPLRT
jgi:hypothetical protein